MAVMEQEMPRIILNLRSFELPPNGENRKQTKVTMTDSVKKQRVTELMGNLIETAPLTISKLQKCNGGFLLRNIPKRSL